jgi:hypothetical protein
MPGASRQPKVAMEIIVESAVLYSITVLVDTAILLFETTLTSGNTYDLFAELFFAYMAVVSQPSCLSVLAF